MHRASLFLVLAALVSSAAPPKPAVCTGSSYSQAAATAQANAMCASITAGATANTDADLWSSCGFWSYWCSGSGSSAAWACSEQSPITIPAITPFFGAPQPICCSSVGSYLSTICNGTTTPAAGPLPTPVEALFTISPDFLQALINGQIPEQPTLTCSTASSCFDPLQPAPQLQSCSCTCGGASAGSVTVSTCRSCNVEACLFNFQALCGSQSSVSSSCLPPQGGGWADTWVGVPSCPAGCCCFSNPITISGSGSTYTLSADLVAGEGGNCGGASMNAVCTAVTATTLVCNDHVLGITETCSLSSNGAGMICSGSGKGYCKALGNSLFFYRTSSMPSGAAILGFVIAMMFVVVFAISFLAGAIECTARCFIECVRGIYVFYQKKRRESQSDDNQGLYHKLIPRSDEERA